ncbi:cystinosin ers1p repeat containing protein [Nannochloropsis oceanica]
MPRRHGGGSGSYYDEEKAAQSPHALLQAPLLLRMEQGNDEEEHNGLERDQEIARVPSCGASTAQCLIWARRKLLGYVVLLLLGLVLGLALPKNKQLQHDPASAALSNILGWTYFLAWTVSFYPQLLLNYRQQTTEGLSLDFELLNFLGFLFYTAFALALQTAPSIQQAYRNQNDGHENKVTIQDVVFAGHAVLITAVTIAQMFYYDGFDPKRKRLSRPISLVVLGLLATTVLALTVAGARGAKPSDWLDFLYILSYMKLFITIIKGIPQAYLNYIRKSTSGWSIHNILCDFTGGLFSVMQLVVDCQVTNDWKGINGDLLKFFLGLFSMAFDVFFIVQHFILYPSPHAAKARPKSAHEPRRRGRGGEVAVQD